MAKDRGEKGLDRREFLHLVGGTVGGIAFGTLGARDAGAQGSSQKINSRSNRRFPGKPNFLILMCDEERFPPIYETPQITQWRKQNLITQQLLLDNGVEFKRHYTGATACVPARGTIFTGQYPSLHGATQTTGVAKGAYDAETFWLDPNAVPTMGDYFRAAGYRTYYKGKWHISAADLLVPGTHQPVLSYNPNNGVRNPQIEQLYLNANRLDGFGFSGWIGAEPHGKAARDTGSSAATGVSGRDIGFAGQVIDLLDSLENDRKADPWLVIASFVNPHDIAVYGFFTANNTGEFKFAVDGTIPTIPPPPTIGEDLLLNHKPLCQESYRRTYGQALQPVINTPVYRQVYYQLQKNVDQQMLRVFTKLEHSSLRDDTIVIFLSDHGELLGAHGGLHQKWYCAYEEVLHVPMIFHNRRLFEGHQSIEMLTSHVDLLPTMLGLAGADVDEIQKVLKRDHSEVHPLVGRDLSPLLLGEGEPDGAFEPLYFMTDDDITRGLDQNNWHGWHYNSVLQPNHVESVIATFKTSGARVEIWKYSRYFDNTQFWTDPSTPQDDVMQEFGPQDPIWGNIKEAVCVTTQKTTPRPEEYEMYNLSADPLEEQNLAGNPQYAAMQQQMADLLTQQRDQKRLTPTVS